MPRMGTHAHGLHHTIDYVEIPVDDLGAARAFYGAAFGWTFVDYGEGYTGIRTAAEEGEDEAGGLALVERSAPSRGGPLVLVYSDDLDATRDAVEAAGGRVVQGPYAFPGGRRLHVLDPAGNELGIWSAR